MLFAYIPLVAAASRDEFVKLRDSLKQFVTSGDSSRTILLLVRASFHDLVNFDPASGKGGPHGCIAKQPIAGFVENNGLSDIVTQLATHVRTKFPGNTFTFGDVISLAGKVAIETAYPCTQVPWRFGRSECTSTDEKESGPPGTLNSTAAYQPFMNRYSFSLADWGILTAGSHGIAGATGKVQNSGFLGPFVISPKSSGKDWIAKSLSEHFSKDTPGTDLQYLSDTGIWRLPSDMVFFPDALAKVNPPAVDNTATSAQNSLKAFLTRPESDFNTEFIRVYAKMLEIGINSDSLTTFVEQPVCGSASSSIRPTTTPSPVPSNSAKPTPSSTQGPNGYGYGHISGGASDVTGRIGVFASIAMVLLL